MLSDCPDCWDTPCMCGHEYKDWSHDNLNALIRVLTSVRDEKLSP